MDKYIEVVLKGKLGSYKFVNHGGTGRVMFGETVGLPNVVVNRVGYRGSIELDLWNNGEKYYDPYADSDGTWIVDPKEETWILRRARNNNDGTILGPYVDWNSFYIRREDWLKQPSGNEGPSTAARKKLVLDILEVVNKWAKENPELMEKAKVLRDWNKYKDAEVEADKKYREYQEAYKIETKLTHDFLTEWGEERFEELSNKESVEENE